MSGPRYKKYRIITNNSEYYAPLRKSRGLKAIRQYETPYLKNPTVAERAGLVTDTHIWKYGDRLYKLSTQYYADPRFWWIIAWYNAVPCEADIRTGRVLYIPINLENVLKTLGVT